MRGLYRSLCVGEEPALLCWCADRQPRWHGFQRTASRWCNRSCGSRCGRWACTPQLACRARRENFAPVEANVRLTYGSDSIRLRMRRLWWDYVTRGAGRRLFSLCWLASSNLCDSLRAPRLSFKGVYTHSVQPRKSRELLQQLPMKCSPCDHKSDPSSLLHQNGGRLCPDQPQADCESHECLTALFLSGREAVISLLRPPFYGEAASCRATLQSATEGEGGRIATRFRLGAVVGSLLGELEGDVRRLWLLQCGERGAVSWEGCRLRLPYPRVIT